MFKNGSLNLIYLLIAICIFMSFTCVNASDLNITDDANNLNNELNVSSDEPVVELKYTGSDEYGGFSELSHDLDQLSAGDTYEMEKDYYYRRDTQPDLGIAINTDNITINGNGHIMDGGYQSAFFTVNGKNVKIINMTFTKAAYNNPKVTEIGNFKFQSGRSPIHWIGDEGTLSSCVFLENSAQVMGGAVTWTGNNGTIENSLFINNTAGMIGGAIYIKGSNNRIGNCMFINSASQIGGDVIYIDRNHRNCTISSIFDSEMPVMDGNITGIDVSCFGDIYESSFAGEKINLVPLIYSAIISKESSVRLNRDTTYYAQYIGNEFLFTLTKNYGRLDYQRCYHLHNVESLSDVFHVLVKENYKNEFIFTATELIFGGNSYEDARTLKANDIMSSEQRSRFETDKSGLKKDLVEVTYQLVVQFEDTLTIDSKKTWNPSKNGFDVVNIIGHGSTIKTKSGNRDEHNWLKLDGGCIFCASNLTITGFNRAVDNRGGICILNNVNFNKNKMDYWFDKDWGAAILNAAICICTNCSFTKNECENGGAIFNQGNLTLNNCSFKNNEAYTNGDNVLNVDKGEVYVNGDLIKGSKGCVKYVKSISTVLSTIIGAVGIIASFTLGTIVGLATMNPLIGFASGAGVGAVVGSICSAIIVTNNYDINYNRLAVCVSLIAGCALAGGLGGVLGSCISASASLGVGEAGVAEDTASIFSSSGLESAESVSELSSEWDGFLEVWDAQAENFSVIEEVSESEILSNSLHLIEATV